MVKKVIMNLDLSKASGPYCISVVVLQNSQPELSYILAEVFNMRLKESCFPNCLKVSLVVPVFKMLGKGLQPKNTALLVFFSVVIKLFEKFGNNRLVDHLNKLPLFLIPIWFSGFFPTWRVPPTS